MAKLIVPELLTDTEDGIVGVTENECTTISLTGRFEHKSGLDRGYNAKFFMPKSKGVLKLFGMENTLFRYEGRKWDIVRIIPMQTHTVIWLN
jgi:hypothetical protein